MVSCSLNTYKGKLCWKEPHRMESTFCDILILQGRGRGELPPPHVSWTFSWALKCLHSEFLALWWASLFILPCSAAWLGSKEHHNLDTVPKATEFVFYKHKLVPAPSHIYVLWLRFSNFFKLPNSDPWSKWYLFHERTSPALSIRVFSPFSLPRMLLSSCGENIVWKILP